MSLIPRLTLIGLYKYNNSLFANLSLPDEIDNETFIDTLLMEYGECPLCSPDLDYMLLAIGAWSRKNYTTIERIYKALHSEYNPIHNYDRTEQWTETEKTKNDYTIDREHSTEINLEGTEENQISAYNESDYQPDNKQLNNNLSTDEGTNNDTYSGTGERGNTKTGRTFGNIGTMTTQKMISEELKLRTEQNLYHIIAEMFYKEFCLYVY